MSASIAWKLALCLPLLGACAENSLSVDGEQGTGGAAPLAPCVERAAALPRPPTRGLPCELLSPNLSR